VVSWNISYCSIVLEDQRSKIRSLKVRIGNIKKYIFPSEIYKLHWIIKPTCCTFIITVFSHNCQSRNKNCKMLQIQKHLKIYENTFDRPSGIALYLSIMFLSQSKRQLLFVWLHFVFKQGIPFCRGCVHCIAVEETIIIC